MTDEAIAARTKRRSRSELRRADNDQLLEWWVAVRSEEVRSELAVRYQQMAKNLASRFANRGESREDLAQVAAYGILKALTGTRPTGAEPSRATPCRPPSGRSNVISVTTPGARRCRGASRT